MVWGFVSPIGFGDYFPDGSFEGCDVLGQNCWDSRLFNYYRALNEDEQKQIFGDFASQSGLSDFGDRYVASVYKKFSREIGVVDRDIGAVLMPFLDHEPPKFFLTKKTYANLSSIIQLARAFYAVDRILKEIIELLEPGVHQFFPLEIRMPRQKVYREQYYTMVVGRRLDTLDAELSLIGLPNGIERIGGDMINFYDPSNKGTFPNVALTKNKFSTSHLWIERRFSEGFLCFSDKLVAEIEKAGLRIFKHYRMKEV